MFTPEDCYYHLYLHLYLSLHQVNTGLEVVSCKNIGINIEEFGSKYRANIYRAYNENYRKNIGPFMHLQHMGRYRASSGLSTLFSS